MAHIIKGTKMQNATKTQPQTQAVKKPQVYAPVAGKVTLKSLQQAVASMGGWANVTLVFNKNLVKHKTIKNGVAPLPFGYTGTPNGVRAVMFNWLLNGTPVLNKQVTVNKTINTKSGPKTVKAYPIIPGKTSKCLGYAITTGANATCSYSFGFATGGNRPAVLITALLNGGFSPSAATWGTAFATITQKAATTTK